jgi:hypothetical protein
VEPHNAHILVRMVEIFQDHHVRCPKIVIYIIHAPVVEIYLVLLVRYPNKQLLPIIVPRVVH